MPIALPLQKQSTYQPCSPEVINEDLLADSKESLPSLGQYSRLGSICLVASISEHSYTGVVKCLQNLPRCWGRAGKGPFSDSPCPTVCSEAKKQAMRRVSRNMSALS